MRTRSNASGQTSRGWGRINSDRTKFFAFLFFVLIVTFMGGGSRSDISSLIVLRPMSVLFCLYATLSMGREEFRSVMAPLLVLLGLLGIAIFQIIPLPAPFWSRVEALESISQSPVFIDVAGAFRPISLDPNRTWNSIFALFVPISAVCLFAIQAPRFRDLAGFALLCVTGSSALVAIAQALGGDVFYLYRITNYGAAVGLFANRNHQSILLLWLMMSACFHAGWSGQKLFPGKLSVGMAVAIVLSLIPLLILTGSRAGLALSGPTLGVCAWLLVRSAGGKMLFSGGGRRKKTTFLWIGVIASALIAIVFVLFLDNRDTAISRLFEQSAVDDSRAVFLPVYIRMAVDFLPFGSGFGSFENIFNAYEPVSELSVRYMNQAHNDLLQLAIEGGVPALAVLLSGGLWLCRAVWKLWRSSHGGTRSAAIYLGASIALWFAASLVDYPLRTPLAAMVVAVLTAQLSSLSRRARLNSGSPDQRAASGSGA